MESTTIGNTVDMDTSARDEQMKASSSEWEKWYVRSRTEAQEHQALTVQKGVKILTYLYLSGIKFNLRKGPKEIAANFTNLPVTREETKLLVDSFESLGLTKHKSGEFPAPEDLPQYEHYKYCDFDESGTKFTVPQLERLFFNSQEYVMYEKAYDEYQTKYYFGSHQEYVDQQKELDEEMEYLHRNIWLPEGCVFKKSSTWSHILLEVYTAEAYEELRYDSIYEQWHNASWGQFTFAVKEMF